MNSVCKEEENFSGSYLILLSMLGLICCLFGLMATLLKCAHHLWPILLAALFSFFLIWGLKKSGLFFSYFLLACTLPIAVCKGDLFWPILLSSSLALSYLLLFLGHKEAFMLLQCREESMLTLKEMNTAALSHVARLEASLKSSQSEMGISCEKLKNALIIAETKIASLQSQCAMQEQEKNAWKEKCDQLLEQMLDFQRKEEVFLRQIEERDHQLAQMNAYEEDPTEMKSLHVLQAQYGLLKEQFEEKSEVLHQTRKALFDMESNWLLLQKHNEENLCRFSEEDDRFFSSIYNVQEHCLQLEKEVLSLEELVSFLLSPKSPSASPKKRNKKEAQDDLFVMIQTQQSVSTS